MEIHLTATECHLPYGSGGSTLEQGVKLHPQFLALHPQFGMQQKL